MSTPSTVVSKENPNVPESNTDWYRRKVNSTAPSMPIQRIHSIMSSFPLYSITKCEDDDGKVESYGIGFSLKLSDTPVRMTKPFIFANYPTEKEAKEVVDNLVAVKTTVPNVIASNRPDAHFHFDMYLLPLESPKLNLNASDADYRYKVDVLIVLYIGDFTERSSIIGFNGMELGFPDIVSAEMFVNEATNKLVELKEAEEALSKRNAQTEDVIEE